MTLGKILIFSQDNDQSTSEVISWLNYLGAQFLRINKESSIELLDYIIDDGGKTDVHFNVYHKRYKLSEFDACWYRRGLFPTPSAGNVLRNYQQDNNASFFGSLERTLHTDYEDFTHAIHHLVESKKTLNYYSKANNNKLWHFQTAHSLGLKVPPTLVTGNKSSLIAFFEKYNGNIITKTISNPVLQGARIEEEDVFFQIYTTLLEKELIDQLPETFYPSLFQHNIPKSYEVRAFYLDGNFYAMAILSQFDKQTSLDFRRYNQVKPNRNIPYQLPESIENKLRLFMQKIELNCGSFDMIVTPGKEYYFLEINPVGQFSMTSVPCNYNLEKKIAEYLIS